MLELDSSLFFISFLIAVLAFVLNRLFFRPIGRAVREREAKNAADAQKLSELLGRIASDTQSLEARLLAGQRTALAQKEERIRRGEEIRRRMVEEARERSQRLLAGKLEELDRQIATAGSELETQVHSFARQIQASIL